MSDKRERNVDGVRQRDPADRDSPWLFKIRIDTSEGKRQLVRSGFRTERQARDRLRAIVNLLDPDVAGTNDWFRRKLGDLIFEQSCHGGVLPTKDEVRAWRSANHDPTTSVPTLARFLDDWLADKDVGQRYGYASRLRRDCDIYWKPLLGEIPVDQITEGHVRDVRKWLLRRNEVVAEVRAANAARPKGRPPMPVPRYNPDGPLSEKRDVRQGPRVLQPSSIAQIFVTLLIALQAAVDRGYIADNPATRKRVPLPEIEHKELVTWTADEVGRFLDYVFDEGDRLAVAYQLVLLFGLRSAEVRGLRWRNVNLSQGWLGVEEQLVRKGKTLVPGKPKTDEGRRTIQLDDDTVVALKAHRKSQLEERLAAGVGRLGADDLVFCKEDGLPLASHELLNAFKARTDEVGNPPLTLHGGRHTAGTLMIENGTDPKTVSKVLGHRDVKFTLNTYVHPGQDAKRAAAQRQAASIPRRVRSS